MASLILDDLDLSSPFTYNIPDLESQRILLHALGQIWQHPKLYHALFINFIRLQYEHFFRP
jgi:hypothetical protein